MGQLTAGRDFTLAVVGLLLMIIILPCLILPSQSLPEMSCMSRFPAIVVIFLVAGAVHGEDWPAWRGPRLDGSSHEKNLPVKWSVTRNSKNGPEAMDNI